MKMLILFAFISSMSAFDMDSHHNVVDMVEFNGKWWGVDGLMKDYYYENKYFMISENGCTVFGLTEARFLKRIEDGQQNVSLCYVVDIEDTVNISEALDVNHDDSKKAIILIMDGGIMEIRVGVEVRKLKRDDK